MLAVADTIPEKAGIFLYGWATDRDGYRRLHVLAPYSEGRFGANDKCYGIPKGAIDAGESPVRAAIRETHEETGINLETLLGTDHYQAFLNGHTVTDVASQGYSGVRVLRADPTPIPHCYTSGHGAKRDAVYYAIEVEGIEHLRPHLKQSHAHESDEQPTVKHPIAEQVKQLSLPYFTEMLSMLRTGTVPAKSNVQWAQPRMQVILPHPVLAELEQRYHSDGNIGSQAEWLKFCRDIPGKEYKRLASDFSALKTYFESCGIIGDSGGLLKMDTKDRPLVFYQEAAEILPVGQMLERSAKVAHRNPLYARAMWGDYTGARRDAANEDERMNSAQIHPVITFLGAISPMELAWPTTDMAWHELTDAKRRTTLVDKRNPFAERILNNRFQPETPTRR